MKIEFYLLKIISLDWYFNIFLYGYNFVATNSIVYEKFIS
jgi:hypothetical protein